MENKQTNKCIVVYCTLLDRPKRLERGKGWLGGTVDESMNLYLILIDVSLLQVSLSLPTEKLPGMLNRH